MSCHPGISKGTLGDSSLWEIGEPDLIVSSPTVEVGAASPDWWGPIGETATGLTRTVTSRPSR